MLRRLKAFGLGADMVPFAAVILPLPSTNRCSPPGPSICAMQNAVDAITAAPWDGAPHNANNPDAEVRRWLFGPLGMAQVLYLVLDRENEVHVLRVVWLELPD